MITTEEGRKIEIVAINAPKIPLVIVLLIKYILVLSFLFGIFFQYLIEVL